MLTELRAFKPDVSPYVVIPSSVESSDKLFTCSIKNQESSKLLSLNVTYISPGSFRFQIDEIEPLHQRFVIPEGDVVLKDLPIQSLKVQKLSDHAIIESANAHVELMFSPFLVKIYEATVLKVILNGDKLFNFESYAPKSKVVEETSEEPAGEGTTATPEPKVTEENWSETFKSHVDSRPKGPASIGLDVHFVDFQHAYGIPEHADTFLLRNTDGIEPYRLYNLDVFGYELDETMALYGSVPMMMAASENGAVGVFWNNPSETWVDVMSTRPSAKGLMSSLFGSSADGESVKTHWMSESGVLDLFVMVGPTAALVSRQYAALTGTTPLPPLFALGYHQCRWNYKDQPDVESLDVNFDKYNIPADVLWLDIEHTNGKRYFTWDTLKFPDPAKMVDDLLKKGRRLVTVVDPHIKSDSEWPLYKDAQSKDLFVKDTSGNEYSGWCWPGSSGYPDFTAPKVRAWWAEQFLTYEPVTQDSMFTWNDMGEPSVFSGPEVTMQKDMVHLNGFEHRDVHNLYGMYVHQASWEGQLLRSGAKKRPFVLTRAFYAGSQRTAAVWTGDNDASWSHLKYSIPMLLSLSLSGVTLCGADVGGFFNNPNAELLTRWYQAGAFQPFFRAHAHLDTERREPWLFPEETVNRIRAAVQMRYALLPYWYTLFAMSEFTGQPPMVPLWYHIPGQPQLLEVESTYMIGDALLVSPVTASGESSHTVTLPSGSTWYKWPSFMPFQGGEAINVSVDMDSVPVFYRSGRIVPRRERMRRSTWSTHRDPYTIYVFASRGVMMASGYIYEDDYESINDPKRRLLKMELRLKPTAWTSELVFSVPEDAPESMRNERNGTEIERIVLVGFPRLPNRVRCFNTPEAPRLLKPRSRAPQEGHPLVFSLKLPRVKVGTGWSIEFEVNPNRHAEGDL